MMQTTVPYPGDGRCRVARGHEVETRQKMFGRLWFLIDGLMSMRKDS